MSCSASSVSPPSSVTWTRPFSPATFVISTPARARRRRASRERLGELVLTRTPLRLGTSRGATSRRTTSAPSEFHACASSQPTGPPPITIRLSGTSFAVVPSRLVHGSASARPGIGGSEAVVPVATITALRAVRTSSPAITRRSPSRRASERNELDAAILEPRQHARVVEVVDDLVAALEDRCGGRAARRRARRRARGRLRRSAPPGRTSAFEGMQA